MAVRERLPARQLPRRQQRRGRGRRTAEPARRLAGHAALERGDAQPVGPDRHLGRCSELDAHLASSYGIFSGQPKAWATIRFSSHAARWVADEHWHSQQKGEWLPDGRYELKVPYSNSRELLMDVLKYGPDAEIVAPMSLREEMKILLGLALGEYGAGTER